MTPLSPSDERFNRAIVHVLKHEGLLSNNSNDPGGITNYGISLRFLKREGIDLDEDGDVDEQDIRGLTIDKAREVYKKYFWDRHGYDKLINQQVAEKVLDLSVNMGNKATVKILQKSINSLERYPVLKVDGILGKHTIDAANRYNPNALRSAMRIFAQDKYLLILINNPQFEGFREGWLKRGSW